MKRTKHDLAVREDASAADHARMTEALALAAKGEGFTRPNPPVGAVIETGSTVVGTGFHRQAGGPHAEVLALKKAGAQAAGGTLYVTLEPCSTQGRTPPCTRAIIESGIRRVVVATNDPNPAHAGRGIRVLRRAGIQTTVGICQTEAQRLIAPFAKWICTGKPYVTLKLGLTLDGRIADAKRRSQWITGPTSRKRVQDLRRRADAIMVGSGTACTDDPSLTCRIAPSANLYRVIVDSTGKTPLSARVLNDDHVQRTILAVTDRCPETTCSRVRAQGVTVWRLPSARNRVSLKTLMSRLGKMGLMHVLCEGGGALAGALVEGNLVDEAALFIAPKLLGADGAPAIASVGWSLKGAPEWSFTGVEMSGDDIMVRAIPRKTEGD